MKFSQMVKVLFLFLFLIQSILIPLNLLSSPTDFKVFAHQDSKKEKKSPIDIEVNEENEENEKVLLLTFESFDGGISKKAHELYRVILVRLVDNSSPVLLLNNSLIIWYQNFRI